MYEILQKCWLTQLDVAFNMGIPKLETKQKEQKFMKLYKNVKHPTYNYVAFEICIFKMAAIVLETKQLLKIEKHTERYVNQ